MSKTKIHREKKRQLGQFLTPLVVARRVVADLPLTASSRVLEPSLGDGAFVIAVLERLAEEIGGARSDAVEKALRRNVFGMEIDPVMHARCLTRIEEHFGITVQAHNLECGDFFRRPSVLRSEGSTLFGDGETFDVVIGNPPFGGTIEPAIQDRLDAKFGERDGLKIKKETYSFFIVACAELLAAGGVLRFICSDTFLTIPTMKGLREFLLNRGSVRVSQLSDFSDETNQPMVVLNYHRGERAAAVLVEGRSVGREIIELTDNRSWRIDGNLARYFGGPKLGELMTASSGMTIGQNELFVREIRGGRVVEPFAFEFFDDPITLAREIERARLGYLGEAKTAEIIKAERSGACRRNVRVVPRAVARSVRLPHADYCYYNKACPDILFAPPRHAVFWKDDGDAVLTFKRNGNWYLHGVGGMPFFKREGLSWQLISPRLNMRYLPAGYVLDSGAPCAFLNEGIAKEELWFILGWTLTDTCTMLLKTVLNHTRNIQSKDFERLPYPCWVSRSNKDRAIAQVEMLVGRAMRGERFDRRSVEVCGLGSLYAWPGE